MIKGTVVKYRLLLIVDTVDCANLSAAQLLNLTMATCVVAYSTHCCSCENFPKDNMSTPSTRLIKRNASTKIEYMSARGVHNRKPCAWLWGHVKLQGGPDDRLTHRPCHCDPIPHFHAAHCQLHKLTTNLKKIYNAGG